MPATFFYESADCKAISNQANNFGDFQPINVYLRALMSVFSPICRGHGPLLQLTQTCPRQFVNVNKAQVFKAQVFFFPTWPWSRRYNAPTDGKLCHSKTLAKH